MENIIFTSDNICFTFYQMKTNFTDYFYYSEWNEMLSWVRPKITKNKNNIFIETILLSCHSSEKFFSIFVHVFVSACPIQSENQTDSNKCKLCEAIRMIDCDGSNVLFAVWDVYWNFI